MNDAKKGGGTMNNREKCLMLIDNFNEDQLANIAILLESVKSLSEDAADDSYCLRLYTDYLMSADKDNTITLEDFAASLEINLS